jgi:hypothetical protein
MTRDREELFELLEALCDGAITPDQHERLQDRLATDEAARRLYFDYLDLRLHLRQWQRASLAEQASSNAGLPDAGSSGPLVIQTSPGLPAPFAAPYSQLGGFAFSYVAATLIVGIGLLIGWAYQVSTPQSDRQESVRNALRSAVAPSRPESNTLLVGRIIGMVDCQWADPRTAPLGSEKITLGRRYVLTSGLLEIAYDTGARVILQGPCTYEVESRTSGYLTLGRLTARVEKKGEGGRRKAERSETSDHSIAKSQIIDPSSPFPLPPSAFFSVRTPTAIVTDLGTEFGVEVDESGASEAHVYRGKIELRAVDRSDADPNTVPLGENESARVELGKDRVAKVVREPSRPGTFVRQLPRRAPVKLFNTGATLKPGDPDPHWQLVARSDDPGFKPRQAVVANLNDPRYVTNQPNRSQWISGVDSNPTMPDNVVYTFRTAFDLTGMRPVTAILHGRFVVDNHVRAIRLNGHEVRVVSHGHEEFGLYHAFSAKRGFVEGANVLEIDVENGDPDDKVPSSPMSLLLELEGSALTTWPGPSDDAIDAKREPSKK